VKPILKKSNLDPFDLKSWRPISNIGFVAKIIERIAIQRFNSNVAAHELLPMLPTDHAIQLKRRSLLYSMIARTVEGGQVCALVLLDVSAAFDTVDHGILTEVLRKRFAIDGGALD